MIDSIKEYFAGPAEKPAAKQQDVPKQSAPKPQAPAAVAPMKANTLARVGSWSITIEEFEERIAALKEVLPDFDINDPESRKLILDELVNQQVMVMAAEEKGIHQKKEIREAVEEFRKTLLVRQLAQDLTENIQVTESEAREFYDENKEMMIGLSEWHVREIVVETKDEATNILTELLRGADFAQMAIQHSIGETANNGGDLGFITQEPFPQMGTALLPLEEGDVSSVFKGPEGYYIVKLEEKRGGQPIAYQDIRGDIIQSQTVLKQQQAILDFMESMKAKMDIKTNEGLL